MTFSLFNLADSALAYSELINSLLFSIDSRLSNWFGREDYLTQAATVFEATAGTKRWERKALKLQDKVLSGDYGVRLEVRSGAELGGALGAFSPRDTTKEPTIYLNGDWLATASAAQVEAVLIEELGHAFDRVLNGDKDSAGDEGEIFANLVLGKSQDIAALQQQDDRRVLRIDGQRVQVEVAEPAPPILDIQSSPLVQTFYAPFSEDQWFSLFQTITTATPPQGTPIPSSPITSLISIAAISDGTIIIYDHWEDGYELDLNNPTQSTTQIWGDGDLTNGIAPGTTNDLINAGDTVLLSNQVVATTSSVTITAGTPADPYQYNGRDKIAVTQAVTLTRTGWAAGSDTLLAGSVEVFDTGNWGTEYRVPVGVNIPDSDDFQMFQYTGLLVMAGAGGATISFDNNNDGDFTDSGEINNLFISEGQSYFIDGGVNVGARIQSDNPVQVHMFTGDIGSNYESRDTALLPVNLWSNSYYAPVSTAQGSTGDARTRVWLYNPSSSSITVKYQTRNASGLTAPTDITVAANSYASQLLTEGFGARFYTEGATPPNFYAFSTTDSNSSTINGSGGYSNNQAWDWSHSLIPESFLTSQVLIGLGIGRDPTSSTNLNENGNPIWITTVGNGNTDAVVYVDFDADPTTGSLTDPNGNRYDVAYTLKELQQQKIFDADGNQSGTLIYTLDPGVKISAAWGQDPLAASAGAPGLDVGTGIPPMPEFSVGKNGQLVVDNDGDGFISPGDVIEYKITVNNTSRAPVANIRLFDDMPVNTTYVAGSTFFVNANGVSTLVSDAGSGTPFVLDEEGYLLNNGTALSIGESYSITFRVLIDSFGDLTPGTTQIVNSGTATSPITSRPLPFSNTKFLYGSIGDRLWSDTDADGEQDPGESGLVGVTVFLDTNDNGTLNSGERSVVTGANGTYVFNGLLSGNYNVRVLSSTLPASVLEQTFDLDGTGTLNKATVILAGGQNRTDVDFGYKLPIPTVDLNSGPTETPNTTTATTDRITAGNFTVSDQDGPPSPWSEGGNSSGRVRDERWTWEAAPSSTLAQSITVPLSTTSMVATSPTTEQTTTTSDAVTSISFGYAWQNQDSSNINTLTVSYGGVDYARFTTSNVSGNGTWAVISGSGATLSGGTSQTSRNERTGTLSNITITLPNGGVTNSGNLVFTYADSTGGGTSHDDIAIDNVVLNTTRTTTVTTKTVDNNYNWATTYNATVANPTPVSIADTDSSVFQPLSPDMQSATIVLTNPSAGDKLLVNGVDANNGTFNGIGWTRTNNGTQINFSGVDDPVAYAELIEAVQFSSPGTIDNTDRIVNVTVVNEFGISSNTAVAVINIAPVSPASISGFVYVDTDNDGIKETGEMGIGGVEVILSGSNDLGTITPIAVQTAADGSYNFGDLRPGTYTITQTQPAAYGDGIDTPGTNGATANGNDIFNVTLASGQTSAGNNFGEVGGRISGFVLDDRFGDNIGGFDTATVNPEGTNDKGIANVPIKLIYAGVDGIYNSSDDTVYTTTTNSSGFYEFTDLVSGLYRIIQTDLPSYTSVKDVDINGDPKNNLINNVNLAPGQNLTERNFLDESQPGSISGSVFDDSTGTTDGNFDSGDRGIKGVEITLRTGNGLFVSSTTTGPNGSYSFNDLDPGIYQVSSNTLTNYYTSITDRDNVAGGASNGADLIQGINLASGQAVTNQDFLDEIVALPAIRLEKFFVSTDQGQTSLIDTKGETITYFIVLTNTGGIAVENVAVDDPMLGGLLTNPDKTNGNTDDILEDGEIWTYTGTVVVNDSLLANSNYASLGINGLVFDSFADALPDQIDVLLTLGSLNLYSLAGGLRDSYLDGTFSNPDPSAKTILNRQQNVWCVDVDRAAWTNQIYRADVYSSYEAIPFGAGVDIPDNLDLVNWIINQDWIGVNSGIDGAYTAGDVQLAIWELIDDNTTTVDLGTVSNARVTEILRQASAIGPLNDDTVSYTPSFGDKLGVIVVPVDQFGNVLGKQRVMVELVIPQTGSLTNTAELSYDHNSQTYTQLASVETPFNIPLFSPAPTPILEGKTIIGDSLANTLIGTPGDDIINGKTGKDTLTGGIGADTFEFGFAESFPSNPDWITDFVIGEDSIDLLTATGSSVSRPTVFNRLADTTIAFISSRNLNTLAGTFFTSLQANDAFLVNVTDLSTNNVKTYIGINDHQVGYQNRSDLMIDITGYSGTLPGVGSIANIGDFFA